jgi:hypothetical protein
MLRIILSLCILVFRYFVSMVDLMAFYYENRFKKKELNWHYKIVFEFGKLLYRINFSRSSYILYDNNKLYRVCSYYIQKYRYILSILRQTYETTLSTFYKKVTAIYKYKLVLFISLFCLFIARHFNSGLDPFIITIAVIYASFRIFEFFKVMVFIFSNPKKLLNTPDNLKAVFLTVKRIQLFWTHMVNFWTNTLLIIWLISFYQRFSHDSISIEHYKTLLIYLKSFIQ